MNELDQEEFVTLSRNKCIDPTGLHTYNFEEPENGKYGPTFECQNEGCGHKVCMVSVDSMNRLIDLYPRTVNFQTPHN